MKAYSAMGFFLLFPSSSFDFEVNVRVRCTFARSGARLLTSSSVYRGKLLALTYVAGSHKILLVTGLSDHRASFGFPVHFTLI